MFGIVRRRDRNFLGRIDGRVRSRFIVDSTSLVWSNSTSTLRKYGETFLKISSLVRVPALLRNSATTIGRPLRRRRRTVTIVSGMRRLCPLLNDNRPDHEDEPIGLSRATHAAS